MFEISELEIAKLKIEKLKFKQNPNPSVEARLCVDIKIRFLLGHLVTPDSDEPSRLRISNEFFFTVNTIRADAHYG